MVEPLVKLAGLRGHGGREFFGGATAALSGGCSGWKNDAGRRRSSPAGGSSAAAGLPDGGGLKRGCSRAKGGGDVVCVSCACVREGGRRQEGDEGARWGSGASGGGVRVSGKWG